MVNLMAVWRAHGLAPVMRQCWEAGVVLAGWSAGSLCWHRGGPTDSFGDSLAVFSDGLGLLHYIGTELHEVVAMRDGAQAWRVEPSASGYHDEPLPPRRL